VAQKRAGLHSWSLLEAVGLIDIELLPQGPGTHTHTLVTMTTSTSALTHTRRLP